MSNNHSATLRASSIAAARDYQQLPAWQKAVSLAEMIYSATASSGTDGLIGTLRASSVAIASHIAAAGAGSESGAAVGYMKAQSAVAETATQLEIAKRLGFVEVSPELLSAVEEVSRLLIGMKHSLKTEAKDTERNQRMDARAEREREYKPRDDRGGDRPYRKPYEDKGERKPYGEKKPYENRGERKPYGDKKPYGERKPYEGKGERKPYEGKKPYGERKPFRKPRD